ncbi:MAG: GTP 3',8-cyclase MoaA [Armatimonadetes bacterium]|nr:GTP 3',8-cyclase MoaA [Armatimonadota bacterium]
MALVDTFGRSIVNLRVSLTDKCDMRCVYCMPEEGMRFFRGAEILTFDEIERVVRVAVDLGIRKVRLTGGEPLLRPDAPEIVSRLARIEGLADIGLTTNGVHLERLAAPLHEAGLRRINVSLDSLDPERFQRITRRAAFHAVMAGLAAAERVGFHPIKVNVVAVHGTTEDEVIAFAELARRKPYQVRFIEFMPLDGGGAWSREAVLPGREILARIHARWPLVPVSRNGHAEPATVFRFADGRGEVGIIPTVTEPFCERCNRIRLTANGQLHTCLFGERATDLRALLRGGASDAEIARAIADAVLHKEPGHAINEPGFRRPAHTMSRIGG